MPRISLFATWILASTLGIADLLPAQLINGGSVIGAISPARDRDRYFFTVNAGESYQLRVAEPISTPFSPELTVYDPLNTFVACDSGRDVAAIERTAMTSGVHSVVIGDGSIAGTYTSPYELHLTKLPGANEGGALPNGGAVLGFVRRGDLDSYTFFLQAGEQYLLRAVDVGRTSLSPEMTTYDPSGAATGDVSAGGLDVVKLEGTAMVAGDHTVVVADGSSSRSQTGFYDIHFARIPGANEHGELLPNVSFFEQIELGDLDTFTLSPRVGSTARITVDVLGGILSPSVRLYDPNGQLLSSSPGSVPIVTPGTHTLVIADGRLRLAGTGLYRVLYEELGAVPVAGCPGESVPTLSGAPIAASGFTIACPTLMQTCSSTPVIMFGSCSPVVIAVPPPIGCGTCGLVVLSTWGTTASPFTVTPAVAGTAVGLGFCVQCGCIAGGCVDLSGGAHIVVLP